MTAENQIEEMAHLVCEMALKPNSCRECDGRKGGCFTIPKMKILYNAGYRKIYDDHQRQCTCYALGCQMAEQLKSKVAEEIFEIVDITLKVDERDFERQFIESDNEKDAYVALALENYVHGVRKVFAELKKKYTEGGE